MSTSFSSCLAVIARFACLTYAASVSAQAAGRDDERPPPVEVQRSKPAHGARQHDGLMLRVAVGPSYITASQDVDPAPIPRPTGPGTGLLPNLRSTGAGSVSVSGEGLLASVDLGAAAARNAVVFLRGAMNATVAPRAEGQLRDVSDGALTSYLIGIGATYYVMPANVGLTLVGGVLATDLEYIDAGVEVSANTDAGLGLQTDLGKEFWVGDDWAIAVTGRFLFESSGDRTPIARTALNLLGGALLVGVTYQ